MSALLPAEEDVLAALLVWWLAELVEGSPDLGDRAAWSGLMWNWRRVSEDWPDLPMKLASRRILAAGDAVAAIADSERRLEVERCEQEVLRLARAMGSALTDLGFVRDMAKAANALIDAEDEVARHAR